VATRAHDVIRGIIADQKIAKALLRKEIPNHPKFSIRMTNWPDAMALPALRHAGFALVLTLSSAMTALYPVQQARCAI